MTRYISTTVFCTIARPIHEVYEYFIPINLVDILVGWGPLPRVVSTSDQTGTWDTIGSRRTVHLADGSTVSERVTHYLRDEEFGYTVSQFTNPIRFLALQAKGVWLFAESTPGKTNIRWTYTYEAHNAFAAVLLMPIVKVFWKRYMQRAMDTFAHIAERDIKTELKTGL